MPEPTQQESEKIPAWPEGSIGSLTGRAEPKQDLAVLYKKLIHSADEFQVAAREMYLKTAKPMFYPEHHTVAFTDIPGTPFFSKESIERAIVHSLSQDEIRELIEISLTGRVGSNRLIKKLVGMLK